MAGTPPAGNVSEVVFTTHPQATDDTSDDPFVKTAAKCRARYFGPSCKVADKLSHCLNSPRRSALECCVWSTTHKPDFSRLASTANIACVHSDAGQTAARAPVRPLTCIGVQGGRGGKNVPHVCMASIEALEPTVGDYLERAVEERG